jgi:hypothetical protein
MPRKEVMMFLQLATEDKSLALSLWERIAGTAIALMMPMMARTSSSSMSVKPDCFFIKNLQ